MAHLFDGDARKSHGDKLDRMIGQRGEYPPDRASRITGIAVSANAQGDAAREQEETFIAAPPRQVSNHGNIKGK